MQLTPTLLNPSLRGLGRRWSIQGLPSIMPHGMIETPHGVDFSFLSKLWWGEGGAVFCPRAGIA